MFAVLNVNKPSGMTSHDVVAALRRVFNLKKVGHAGTLDPMATGVLPVCLGQATRLIEYFATDKRYQLEITLGITTDTLDQEGEETGRTPCPTLSETMIQDAIQPFIGSFEQQIPAHSAKRVGGQKLYKLAHQGIEVDTPFKTVTVHEIQLIRLSKTDTDHPVIVLDVHCGTGTFMRALARDIGNHLGCGAHLSGLIRAAHGRFALEHAVDLETLQDSDTPNTFLQNPISFIDLPQILLDSPIDIEQIRNGMKLLREVPPDDQGLMKDKDLCALVHPDSVSHELIAIAQWTSRRLKPVKVFPAPVGSA